MTENYNHLLFLMLWETLILQLYYFTIHYFKEYIFVFLPNLFTYRSL